MFLLFTFLLLSFILFFLNFLINMKPYFFSNKFSMFECGFDSFSIVRIPFSLRFFKICILFIFFDIEMILILPIPLMFKNSIFIFKFSSMIIFIIFIGLIFEWNQGSLNWIF